MIMSFFIMKLLNENTDNVKSTLQTYLNSRRLLACRATRGRGDDEDLVCRGLRHSRSSPRPLPAPAGNMAHCCPL